MRQRGPPGKKMMSEGYRREKYLIQATGNPEIVFIFVIYRKVSMKKFATAIRRFDLIDHASRETIAGLWYERQMRRSAVEQKRLSRKWKFSKDCRLAECRCIDKQTYHKKLVASVVRWRYADRR